MHLISPEVLSFFVLTVPPTSHFLPQRDRAYAQISVTSVEKPEPSWVLSFKPAVVSEDRFLCCAGCQEFGLLNLFGFICFPEYSSGCEVM